MLDYGFNPRTYIRYDADRVRGYPQSYGFNPRTYIRYDWQALPDKVHG